MPFADRNSEEGLAEAEGGNVDVNRGLSSCEFASHIGQGVAVAHDSFDFTCRQIIERLRDALVFVRHDSDAAEDFRGEGATECSTGEVIKIRDAFDAV